MLKVPAAVAGLFARRSQLAANIASSLGTAVLSMLVIGIAYPVYLHFLGYEQYGLWLLLSTVVVMAQLGSLGISPALLKLVAEDFAAGDIDGVYKYISCGMLSLAVSGTGLVCGVVLLRRPIVAIFGVHDLHARAAYELLPYIAVLSVCVLTADALLSIVAGLGRYDLVNYSQLAGQLVIVAIAVALLKLRCGLWGMLAASAAGYLFLNLASLVLIRRITRSPRWFRFAWDRRRLGRILNFGSLVFVASILNTAYVPLNKLLVTRFAGIAAVPVYDIAYAASFKIRSLLESGFRSLTPEFSSLNRVSPLDVYHRLVSADRKGMKILLYAGTPLYVSVLAVCGVCLPLWLRGRFTPELPRVFRIMLVGSYVSLWGVQSWYTLLGFGKGQHILAANLAMVLSDIALVTSWRLALHRPVTMAVVVMATGIGFLASTLYLQWQAARLRRALAPAIQTRRAPILHPAAAASAHSATNQSPQRV